MIDRILDAESILANGAGLATSVKIIALVEKPLQGAVGI